MTDDSRVFKALADPTRRLLLDRLFERDGRTLGDLEAAAGDMTRFGVMKHLRLLEEAGLITTRKEGRQKLHFLNPVPIRLIHDRWINKYAERPIAALTQLKHSLENPMTDAAARTTQVYDIYIKAEPQKIWDAITTPEWTARYGYRGPTHLDPRPGGAYEVRASDQMRGMGLPEVIIDGEVVEADPPHKLVHTYRWLFTEESKAEGFTRVTWEIVPTQSGFTRLTVTHELAGAPGMAMMTASQFNERGSGGWNWILSDLKSLLETGSTMS